MKTGKLSTAARALAVSIALCGAGSASAITVVEGSGLNVGPLASPGSFAFTFANNTGYSTGQFSFDLLGNKTLDGTYGIWTDTFALFVNSVPVFGGAFNMGGNGTNYAAGVPGSTWSTTRNGYGLGGMTEVSLPISLLSGNNTIRFAYLGLPQGKKDEGWGIGSYLVTAVPEPETYAMMLAGLGLVGVMARRRRRKG